MGTTGKSSRSSGNRKSSMKITTKPMSAGKSDTTYTRSVASKIGGGDCTKFDLTKATTCQSLSAVCAKTKQRPVEIYVHKYFQLAKTKKNMVLVVFDSQRLIAQGGAGP